MKYLFINSVAGYGSAGRIVAETCRKLMSEGNECAIAWGRVKQNVDDIQTYQIGTKLDLYLHAMKTRLFDGEGFGSELATKRLVKWIEKYNPDVIWLHNLHGYYINIEILFNYIKSKNVKVIWSLHDCWSFTGHCTHFVVPQCDQWLEHCAYCCQTRRYPTCYFKGNAYENFERKKIAFTGVKDLTIITPSKWLKKQVERGFLKEYPVEVRYNTIDTSAFCPTPSDFRDRYNLQDKKIVLGVASIWEKRKGLYDFLQLAEKINDSYKIVMVGFKKNQITNLPSNIIGISRVNSASELAQIYTAADVYLNLTYEDTYPSTNLEAQACGTPCVTYQTGGSVESVPPENVIKVGDVDGVLERIYTICNEK